MKQGEPDVSATNEKQESRTAAVLSVLRRYRLLLLIYGTAVAVAAWEISHPTVINDDITDKAVLPPHADVLVDVWPDHADACYVRNIQARFLRFDLAEAREELKRGMAKGPKSTERLCYENAYVLVLMKAPKAEIEEAVAIWQRNFPFSELKDPRTLVEEAFPPAQRAATHWLGALSPDGVTYARMRSDGTLELWNVTDGSVATVAPNDNPNARFLLGFSQDGETLAIVGSGGAVPLLDVSTLRYTAVLKGHKSAAYAVAFSPDGTVCATGSADHSIRLWDPASGKQLRVLTDHTRTVSALAFSADGKLLASGDWRGTIILRQLDTDHTLTLTGHSGSIAGLALSPDGTSLVSASRDSTVKLWDTATGQERRTVHGHTAPVCTVAYSHDGTLFASGGADGTVRFQDSATGMLQQSIKGPSDVFSITFSADDSTLALACIDNSVRRIAVNKPVLTSEPAR